jgi:hypothetical protein
MLGAGPIGSPDLRDYFYVILQGTKFRFVISIDAYAKMAFIFGWTTKISWPGKTGAKKSGELFAPLS